MRSLIRVGNLGFVKRRELSEDEADSEVRKSREVFGQREDKMKA